MVRIAKQISEQEQAREATWLAAIESNGMTQAELAAMVGLSQGQVSRRLARARASRASNSTSATADSSATPGSFELPRLALVDSETSPANGTTTAGLAYSLATDAVSLDGGTSWIASDDPSTPRMPVLVSDRNGKSLRKHQLAPRPLQAPPEPPGPTSHRKTPGLKGGRG